MSPQVKYRRWSVLKRQIQFNKVHGGRIYILLLQKCGHNDRLHKIALIPPFPMSAVWWMWSQTLTKRPVVGLWMGWDTGYTYHKYYQSLSNSPQTNDK